MKAIANNPEPTSSFIKYNKYFLKNNRFASDHTTHNLIVNMFEAYINEKFKERYTAGGEQKSILKATKNTVRFMDVKNQQIVDIIQDMQPIGIPEESNDGLSVIIEEDEADHDNFFYKKRLKFETNV